MNATSASEDRAIAAALATGDSVSSAVRELVDIIERLDAEIADAVGDWRESLAERPAP